MYSRTVGGQTLTFGHEGVLYKNSFVMYDKETGSLWVHTTGEAVKGRLKGSRLEFLPSMVTPWATWKQKYPRTRVLTGRRARGMMGSFALERALERYGLSVGQGRAVKLYPFDLLTRKIVVNDTFDGKKIVVVFDRESATAAAFERGELEFSWSRGAMRDAGGQAWDPLKGTSGDRSLVPLPATPWLVERWRAFYPKAEVYSQER